MIVTEKSFSQSPLGGASVAGADAFGAKVASGTMATNGNFEAGALTSRVLTPPEQLVGVSSLGPCYEHSHAAKGEMALTRRTLQTATMEKAGYETWRDTLGLNRKKDLEVALPTFTP